jgi:hypothetical protein
MQTGSSSNNRQVSVAAASPLQNTPKQQQASLTCSQGMQACSWISTAASLLLKQQTQQQLQTCKPAAD